MNSRLNDFRSDRRGQILILFALASVSIFAAFAATFDLSKAYAARQRLSEVATLACQYSSRGSVGQTATSTYAGTNGFQTYVNAVNAFVTTSLAAQHWSGTQPMGGTANPNSYFTATAAAGGTSAGASVPSNPVVELTAAVPTSFGQILNVSSITVHARIACPTLATTSTPINQSPLKEGFETGCSSFCVASVSGTSAFSSSAANNFPSSAGYVNGNNKWYIVGYCLEVDVAGVINATTPEGTHSAELDCDNGHGTAGNSSISTSIYLAAGQYELRYNYRSRIDYPDYDPTYICGSTASDVSWANDTSGWSPGLSSNVSRTNQINVYLDANIPGNNGVGSAPLHRTIDGTQYLAGSNVIDICVYSPTWVERSVRVKVTNPGFYWLTFAADGPSDSYGGQLDNIRFCQELCSGTVQDNFPTAWLAANNNGNNKVLFEDTFESPVYSQDTSPAHYIAKAGNLNSSTGTSGSSSGWPSLASSGWATGTYNEVIYAVRGAYQGNQYISLDGYNGFSSGSGSRNRFISRPFLLDPGYYKVSYDYISMVDFSGAGVYGTYCTAAPASGSLYPAIGTSTSGFIRYYQSTSADATTNILGVFMSNGQLVSTPIGGGSLGATTSYTNPDNSISTTPTVQPDYVNWQNYNAGAANPVIDTCGYVDSFRWIPRSVSVKITKPGIYWLTFSAYGGAADGNGAGIDDVTLTALGSPYMSNPPTSALTTIPVPAPQPDSSYTPGTYPGFTIVADPFAPPGADQ